MSAGELKSDVTLRQDKVGRFVDERNAGTGDAGIGAFDEETSELEAELKRGNRILPLLLSMAALVVFGGVVWYAYSWSSGDLSPAALPVIAADDSPVKERPLDEGGLAIPHRDKAVLNDGLDGGQGQPVEHLLPPPEEPKALEAMETDAEPASGAPVAEAPLSEESEATEAAPEERIQESQELETAADTSSQESTQSEAVKVEAAPAPAAPEPVLAPASDAGEAAEEQAASEIRPAQVVEADAGQVVEEPPPLETSNGEPAAAKMEEPVEPVAKLPVDGGYLIQLAAIQDQGKIDSEWRRMQKAFPALLGDMGLIVEEAVVNGKTFYRIQAGPFPTKSTAEDLCAQLKVKKQACILKRKSKS